MKAKDIAKKYGVNHSALTNFISSQSGTLPQKRTLTDIEIDDGNVELLINNFRQYTASAAGNEASRLADIETERQRKQTILANMLITSGFNFDGFTITKYSGYISGDDVVEIDRSTGGIFFNKATKVGDALMASLVTIRRNALAELKEAAYALGCNAVVGVDFDYITLDPETSAGGLISERRTQYLPYVFGVTANGNAVIIEKNQTSSEV
jgi:uncharacterized protein YbjQ (UPF0145 family)